MWMSLINTGISARFSFCVCFRSQLNISASAGRTFITPASRSIFIAASSNYSVDSLLLPQKPVQNTKISRISVANPNFRLPPQIRRFASSSINMGRENIMHYQLQHDHETDIPRDVASEPAVAQEKKPSKPVAAHSNFPFTLSKESSVSDFLANNKYFVDSIQHNHSNQIFELNGKGQSPHTLWIGCSDSRAGEACLATLPGEIFTHRNIANIINANDISSQGVIQFAVDVLKVRKIIICGHTDCGGVWASLSNKKIGGVLDLWLNPIRHIRAANVELLNSYKNDPPARAKKLAELNVIASVLALKRHPSASLALKKGEIEVWGMMYDVGTGYLSEIEIPNDEFEDLFHVSDDHEDEHKAH